MTTQKRPIENALASVKLVFNATGWSRKREKQFIDGVNNIVSVLSSSIGYQNCNFLNERKNVKRTGNDLVITFGRDHNWAYMYYDYDTQLGRLYDNDTGGNDLMNKHSAAIADMFIRALKAKYEKDLKGIDVRFHNIYCEKRFIKLSDSSTFKIVGAKRKQSRYSWNVPSFSWRNDSRL